MPVVVEFYEDMKVWRYFYARSYAENIHKILYYQQEHTPVNRSFNFCIRCKYSFCKIVSQIVTFWSEFIG